MSPNEEIRLKQSLTGLQILTTSLLFGLAIITGVLIFLVQNNDGKGAIEDQEVPFVSFIAIGISLITTLFALVLVDKITPPTNPSNASNLLVTGNQATDPQFERLLGIYQGQLILRYAMFEAPAIIGGLAYFLEAQIWVLAVPAVSLLLMIAYFPSKGKIEEWIERKRMETA